GGRVAAPQGAARKRLCTGPGRGAKTAILGGCGRASGGGCLDRPVQEFLGAEAGRAGDGDRARQARAASRADDQTDREEGLSFGSRTKEEWRRGHVISKDNHGRHARAYRARRSEGAEGQRTPWR